MDNVGSKIAYVNYGKEGINSIFLETPEMTFPFDNTWYPIRMERVVNIVARYL